MKGKRNAMEGGRPMNREEIETFLAILECRNITEVSRRLCATQSTISHRLCLLEAELGCALFERGRGKRSIEVTEAGERFSHIAHQWMELLESTRLVASESARTRIVVGGADIITAYTFAPFFQNLIERHREMQLRIRTHHSDELHLMLENQQIDIGLVFSQLNYPSVVSKPLYRERMYLVCHKDSGYHDRMPLDKLPADYEVYLGWSANYATWHNRHWQPGQYLIHTGTGSQALSFLNVPGRWAIVPWSLFEATPDTAELARYTLAEDPPPRTCYQITHRNPAPRTQRALALIKNELDEYVNALLATGPMLGA